MKRLLCLLLALLLLPVQAPARADAVNDTIVRVLLSGGETGTVTVRLAGKYTAGGKTVKGGTVTAALENGTVTLTHSSEGKLASSETQVRLERAGTGDSVVLTYDNPKHGKHVYFGDFVFYNDDGRLRIVNCVDLHHYLYGVVSGEMSDASKPDLLKVETIAAKGYALSEVAARKSKYFDVYDTTASQLYYGYVASDVNTIAAVDAVWKQTLRYEGRIVKTYYSTADGGQIITPYIRWGGKANDGAYYFGYDPFDLAGSSKNVVLTVSGASPSSMDEALIAFLLEKAGDGAKSLVSVDALEGVNDPEHPEGTERYPKALAPQKRWDWKITVRTDAGKKKQVAFSCTPDEVKAAAAPDAAGSVCFAVRTAKREWKLVWGVQSGHRAGLSHRGATQMVKQGYSYVDVLKFYYRGATLYAEDGEAIESTATFAFTYEEGAPEPTATPEPTAPPETTATPKPTATPQPEYTRDVIVTCEMLNLRKGPSAKTALLATFRLGDILGVYGASGEWLLVRDPGSGAYGYVHGSYVSEYEREPTARWEGVCNADDSNLRAGPSTSFKKYRPLNAGDPVYVYYRSGNWYFVMDRGTGQGGFIYKNYITLGGDAPKVTKSDANGDGKIDASDAGLVLRYLVKLSKMKDRALLAADVNNDGTVDAADAVQILRRAVGME